MCSSRFGFLPKVPPVSKSIAVAMQAPDVYVARFEKRGTIRIATLWKNGVATALTDGTNDVYAYSVFVK